MDSLEHFLHHSNFEQLMEQAYSRVKQFLPADAKDLPLADLPMFYLAFDPESRAMGGAVFFDINQVYEDGKEGFINTAAHELHHHYMDALWDLRYPKDSDDPALTALVYNQMEGTTDLISKPEMPVTKLGLYGPEIVKMYNDDYAATPEVLKQLDNLTCDYAAGKLQPSNLKRPPAAPTLEDIPPATTWYFSSVTNWGFRPPSTVFATYRPSSAATTKQPPKPTLMSFPMHLCNI